MKNTRTRYYVLNDTVYATGSLKGCCWDKQDSNSFLSTPMTKKTANVCNRYLIAKFAVSRRSSYTTQHQVISPKAKSPSPILGIFTVKHISVIYVYDVYDLYDLYDFYDRQEQGESEGKSPARTNDEDFLDSPEDRPLDRTKGVPS